MPFGTIQIIKSLQKNANIFCAKSKITYHCGIGKNGGVFAMGVPVSEEAFAAWATKISLAEKLRQPLRMVYCDRRTATWAARECGLAPSTILRAVEKYKFGQCPCCGEVLALW